MANRIKWFHGMVLMAGLALATPTLAEPEVEFQPPPLREFEVNSREIIRGVPVRGLDIQGQGDGAARHFSYLLKATPGLLRLQLQARAKTGATAFKVRLEDGEGTDVSHLEALAGVDSDGQQIGTYQLENAQTLRLHVNIDPNCGPYSLTLTGPLER